MPQGALRAAPPVDEAAGRPARNPGATARRAAVIAALSRVPRSGARPSRATPHPPRGSASRSPGGRDASRVAKCLTSERPIAPRPPSPRMKLREGRKILFFARRAPSPPIPGAARPQRRGARVCRAAGRPWQRTCLGSSSSTREGFMVAKGSHAEPAPQANQMHPDELQRGDSDPDPRAGDNFGGRPSTVDPSVTLASEIKDRTRRLQGFTLDEPREIPGRPQLARLLQDALRIDLTDPERRPFRATAQRVAVGRVPGAQVRRTANAPESADTGQRPAATAVMRPSDAG